MNSQSIKQLIYLFPTPLSGFCPFSILEQGCRSGPFSAGSDKSKFWKPNPDPTGTHQESIQPSNFFFRSDFFRYFYIEFFTWKIDKFIWKCVKASFLNFFFVYTTLHSQSRIHIRNPALKTLKNSTKAWLTNFKINMSTISMPMAS